MLILKNITYKPNFQTKRAVTFMIWTHQQEDHIQKAQNIFNTDNNQPHFDQYSATHNKNKEQEKTTKEACNTYNENQ